MVAVVNTSGGDRNESVGRFSDYYGKSLEEINLWMTGDAIHPEDRPGVDSGIFAIADLGRAG